MSLKRLGKNITSFHRDYPKSNGSKKLSYDNKCFYGFLKYLTLKIHYFFVIKTLRLFVPAF